ncbi:MAG: LysE family translocator [Hyphomicrobiales bacterium]|nr:LysE family translocator [Hyphomicrobiales bacterium]
MNNTDLVSLALFCFVASITPGPNNLMLMSSGLTYGMRRTLPHMIGVALGFMLMVLLVGLGINALFAIFPWLETFLKIVSILYLLWLAWKIATSGVVRRANGSSGKPMTFMQAASFQWVNPKAWMMAVTAVAVYVQASQFALDLAVVTLIFGVINLPCVAVWASFGTLLRRLVDNPKIMHAINIGMAIALVASLAPEVRQLAALVH